MDIVIETQGGPRGPACSRPRSNTEATRTMPRQSSGSMRGVRRASRPVGGADEQARCPIHTPG
jgi:hypothetical protein